MSEKLENWTFHLPHSSGESHSYRRQRGGMVVARVNAEVDEEKIRSNLFRGCR